MKHPPKEFTKLERVLWWAMYFSFIHNLAKNIVQRQNDLWWGKEGDAPQGILRN